MSHLKFRYPVTLNYFGQGFGSIFHLPNEINHNKTKCGCFWRSSIDFKPLNKNWMLYDLEAFPNENMLETLIRHGVTMCKNCKRGY